MSLHEQVSVQIPPPPPSLRIDIQGSLMALSKPAHHGAAILRADADDVDDDDVHDGDASEDDEADLVVQDAETQLLVRLCGWTDTINHERTVDVIQHALSNQLEEHEVAVASAVDRAFADAVLLLSTSSTSFDL